MEEEVKNGDSLLAAKAKELKDAEAEVVRLDKAIKEYTKSWDKLLEAKDKEIKQTKEELAVLQAKLKATREQVGRRRKRLWGWARPGGNAGESGDMRGVQPRVGRDGRGTIHEVVIREAVLHLHDLVDGGNAVLIAREGRMRLRCWSLKPEKKSSRPCRNRSRRVRRR